MTSNVDRHTELQAYMQAGRYDMVIALLERGSPVTSGEWRMLGLALLWQGRFAEAELPLLRADALGDAEARVEYGNLLRLQGRFSESVKHLEALLPGLEGELRFRALRWWGTAEFQAGQWKEGLERCEQAWRGYMTLDDEQRIGRVTQTLAQMHALVGDMQRARQLYEEALRILTEGASPDARLAAFSGLANLLMLAGDFKAAEMNLKRGREVLEHMDSPRQRAYLLSAEAELHYVSGESASYSRSLQELLPIVTASQDFELRLWTAARLADLYSRQGKHAQALDVLLELSPDADHPAVNMMRGVLLLRRNYDGQAAYHLRAALDSGELTRYHRIRALLFLAEAQLRLGDEAEVRLAFREALRALVCGRDRMLYRPDLQELGHLVQRALLDPDFAPDMRMVLDKLAVPGGGERGEGAPLHLRVFTLGRAEVHLGGEAVALSLEGSALTLAYLALHPGRTRRELEAAIYPDRDPKTAGDYFRAVFRELRVRLGGGVLQMEGSAKQPRYRLGGGVHLELDVTALREALNAGDLPRALALYRGPFLPGLRMESEWAEELREELRMMLTLELRRHLSLARQEGDLRRALLLTNESLRIDPYDLGLLEARVDLARQVAPPQELARYVVELHRMKS